ncbi:hypothetical protein TWF718_005466 [Orbilia javanica]|uniref:Uncharacterized protein n=1 Tax=Orbilia javanica TaxID=47235 RepID=A0AAN8MV05_9PEZI
MHLALQALRKYSQNDDSSTSLLLLLATTNADKPPSPASYDHRLAMMCLLAEEIQNIYTSTPSSPSTSAVTPQIDIGITPHPRFIDKSSDLSSHPFFPSEITRQIWILGYDTLIRLLNPKYYPPTHTLSALHHTLLSSTNRLLVFTRPGTDLGTPQSQHEYTDSLDPSIANKVDMVVPDDVEEVNGVSSTNVRNGVKNGTQEWKRGVCSGVAEWIEKEGLYV